MDGECQQDPAVLGSVLRIARVLRGYATWQVDDLACQEIGTVRDIEDGKREEVSCVLFHKLCVILATTEDCFLKACRLYSTGKE